MSLKLINALIQMEEKEALETTKELIERGEDPVEVLNSCKEALGIVGNRFEKGEYFLPHLVMAGEMLRQISEIVKPKLKEQITSKPIGKVIIGTVKGDIHDIGKNIVTFMLQINGFNVLDLGINVPPEKFTEAIKEFQPAVVGLSGFLTVVFEAMKNTVKAIEDAGLRDKVKIMIGGGQVDDGIRRYVVADAFGLNAMDAVRLAKRFTGRGQ